jgi:hypothetical protein
VNKPGKKYLFKPIDAPTRARLTAQNTIAKPVVAIEPWRAGTGRHGCALTDGNHAGDGDARLISTME